MLLRLLFLGLVILPYLPAEDQDDHFLATEQAEALERTFYSAKPPEDRQDWAAGRKIFTGIIDTKLLPDALVNVMWVITSSYYGVACDDARLGDSKAALHALEQAIAFGWNDHQHMTEDADLENLRTLPRYHEMLQLARVRAAQRTEVGVLFLPENQSNVLLQPDDMDRLALLIPATELIRERALVLTCTKAQRRQLVAFVETKQRVRITGTGGTWSTGLKFKVDSFGVVADVKP